MIRIVLIISIIHIASQLSAQLDSSYLQVRFSQELNSLTKINNDQIVNEIFKNAKGYKLKKSFPHSPFESHASLFDLRVSKQDVDNLLKELRKYDKFISVKEYEICYPLIECTSPVVINDYEAVTNRPDECYQLDLCDFYCAWTLTTGNSNKVVALADTDFDPNHEDLSGKFTQVSGPVSGLHPHGTQTSSMAGASVNNSIGIAGGGYNSRVAGYRVDHSASGFAVSSSIKDAIWQAYLNGEKIISVSWSGSGLSASDAQLLVNAGVSLVLAAGNDTTSTSHSAIADIPGVINVSGVNIDNEHGPTNRARNQWVDLCAPSEAILVGNPSDPSLKYIKAWGTSLSAPITASVIALMKSENSNLTPSQIEGIIKSTCEPIDDASSFPGLLGAGRLNAYYAVCQSTPKELSGTIGGTFRKYLIKVENADVNRYLYLFGAEVIIEGPFNTDIGDALIFENPGTFTCPLN
jgi:subtilisin family serine protease